MFQSIFTNIKQRGKLISKCPAGAIWLSPLRLGRYTQRRQLKMVIKGDRQIPLRTRTSMATSTMYITCSFLIHISSKVSQNKMDTHKYCLRLQLGTDGTGCDVYNSCGRDRSHGRQRGEIWWRNTHVNIETMTRRVGGKTDTKPLFYYLKIVTEKSSWACYLNYNQTQIPQPGY